MQKALTIIACLPFKLFQIIGLLHYYAHIAICTLFILYTVASWFFEVLKFCECQFYFHEWSSLMVTSYLVVFFNFEGLKLSTLKKQLYSSYVAIATV